jgi:hypothetical protein
MGQAIPMESGTRYQIRLHSVGDHASMPVDLSWLQIKRNPAQLWLHGALGHIIGS